MSIKNTFFTLLDEYIEEQPSLLDKNTSTFYVDDEIVQMQSGKHGNKQYIFGPKTSDYVDSFVNKDTADTSGVIDMLADIYAYSNNDDLSKIIQNADREDVLVFNTSSNGVLLIHMDDIYRKLSYLNRMDRNKVPTEEAFDDFEDDKFLLQLDDEEDNQDWLIKWKDSKKPAFEVPTYTYGESTLANYLKNLKETYNKN